MPTSLSIVTVYLFGPQDDFDRTMKSIESQSDQLYEHILVVSGVIDEGSFRSQYAAPNRVLILNEDKSLYHAMNLGLNVVSGEFVFFLNGGDEFTGSDSLGIILNNCKYNSCLLVRTAQYFGSDCYVRPKLNQLDRMKQFPAHQGFISPSVIAKKYKYIDSKYAIGSDTIWMKAILKVCEVVVLPDILVKFSLGGVSNAPSVSTCKRRYNESGSRRLLLEILKLALYNFLGAKYYYRLIFHFKYEYQKRTSP